jgi:iron uptake system EfeUOB component EfeO/EfeM
VSHMELETVFKLRDALQAAVDALQEEIEKHNPELPQQTPANFDPEKISWIKTKNRDGEPYERYPAYQQQPTLTVEYTSLLDKLKQNNNKYFYGSIFYFLFDDGVTIGRKPTKTK